MCVVFSTEIAVLGMTLGYVRYGKLLWLAGNITILGSLYRPSTYIHTYIYIYIYNLRIFYIYVWKV
jgi:hypothetical protein